MPPLLQTIGELASATTHEAVALAVRLRARWSKLTASPSCYEER
jgi:hypothetical protein